MIASAGGKEKCEFVRSLGADAVVDYRRADPQEPAAAAPKGIDVYFDNVGGSHLDAAFALARNNARFAICGMIEGYNEPEPTSLTLHHADHCGAHPAQGLSGVRLSSRGWRNSMARWRRGCRTALSNRGRPSSTDSSIRPTPSLAYSSGENTGKMLVRL